MRTTHQPLDTAGLVERVLALGPSVAQGRWRNAEDPACTAVQGLQVLAQVVEIPGGMPRPKSPIISLSEAESILGRIAPATMALGRGRLYLIALMTANDGGDRINSVRAFWGLVNDMAKLDDLKLRPGEQSRKNGPDRLVIGRRAFYVPREDGLTPMTLEEATETGRPDVVAAREADPAPWNDGHPLAQGWTPESDGVDVETGELVCA